MSKFKNGAFREKPHFCGMKNYFVLILISAALLACEESTKEKQNSEVELNEAVDQTEDVSNSVQHITDKIRKDPKNPDLYLQRSKAHAADMMLLLALDDVNRALSIDSLNSDYHAFKGEVHYLNKEPDKAVESFNRSLELNSENTDALLKLAEIKLLLRRYQECFDLANDALRINDQLYNAYFIKGYAHYELGDSNLFVSSVQTALELNPQFYDGYALLASFYASLESDLALDYYNSALDIRPNDPEALYGKAIYLQNSGRIEEAVEQYQYMIDLDSNHVFAWYNQGYIKLEIEDDPEAAIGFFEKTIEIQPEYVEAHYNLGLSKERAGKVDEAIQHFRHALELNPQYDPAALALERLMS